MAKDNNSFHGKPTLDGDVRRFMESSSILLTAM